MVDSTQRDELTGLTQISAQLARVNLRVSLSLSIGLSTHKHSANVSCTNMTRHRSTTTTGVSEENSLTAHVQKSRLKPELQTGFRITAKRTELKLKIKDPYDL